MTNRITFELNERNLTTMLVNSFNERKDLNSKIINYITDIDLFDYEKRFNKSFITLLKNKLEYYEKEHNDFSNLPDILNSNGVCNYLKNPSIYRLLVGLEEIENGSELLEVFSNPYTAKEEMKKNYGFFHSSLESLFLLKESKEDYIKHIDDCVLLAKEKVGFNNIQLPDDEAGILKYIAEIVDDKNVDVEKINPSIRVKIKSLLEAKTLRENIEISTENDIFSNKKRRL